MAWKNTNCQIKFVWPLLETTEVMLKEVAPHGGDGFIDPIYRCNRCNLFVLTKVSQDGTTPQTESKQTIQQKNKKQSSKRFGSRNSNGDEEKPMSLPTDLSRIPAWMECVPPPESPPVIVFAVTQELGLENSIVFISCFLENCLEMSGFHMMSWCFMDSVMDVHGILFNNWSKPLLLPGVIHGTPGD